MSIQKNRPKAAHEAVAVNRCLPPDPTIDFTVRSWGTGMAVLKKHNSLRLVGTPQVQPYTYGGFIAVDFAPQDPRSGGIFVHLPVSSAQLTLERVAQQIAEQVNQRTPYTAHVIENSKECITILFERAPKAGGDVKGEGAPAKSNDDFSET